MIGTTGEISGCEAKQQERQMGPGYFIIAILGCADGGTQCTPVATAAGQYASHEQCDAAAPAVLLDSSNLDYPTLIAQCRSVRGAASAANADARLPLPLKTRG
jgi:acyl-CoA synthetase (AMP-forming)/AMP-acid ligase II